MSVSEAITSIQRRLGLTQVSLGKKLGVTHASVSRYRRGELTPSASVLLLLFELADGDERKPIVEALGEGDPEEFERGVNKLVKPFLESGGPEAQENVEAAAREFIADGLVPILSAKNSQPATENLLYALLRYAGNPEYSERFIRASDSFENPNQKSEDQDEFIQLAREFQALEEPTSMEIVLFAMRQAIEMNLGAGERGRPKPDSGKIESLGEDRKAS